MPLTRQTNGSSPSNIMQASWWNDYMDLLTGVMSDQPVNINNTILGNNFTADYSNTMGYWIQDSFGIAQRCMHVHTDGDLHLIPSPANNKLRITKNSYAYDIALFDTSGTNGATTLNGTLTLTGGAASLTCTTVTVGTLNATTLNASTFAPSSVTCSGAVQGGSLVSNVLNDLVGGSHLSITTGAGAVTRLQDPTKLSFQIPAGTELASLTATTFTINGSLTAGTLITNTLSDTGGTSHIAITTGGGAVTRIQDPTKLSFQIPGGTELASLTATTFTINGSLTAGSIITNTLSDSTGTSHLAITTGGGAVTRIQDPTKISLQIPGGTEQASLTGSTFTINGALAVNNIIDSVGNGHLVITTGAGAITRLEDPTKISLQVPGGSERLYVNSTNVISNVTLSAPVVRFATGGFAKETSGSQIVTTGTQVTVNHGCGSSNVFVFSESEASGMDLLTGNITASQVTFYWSFGATSGRAASFYYMCFLEG